LSRSERLLKLIHLLRSYRYPAPGYQLAETLGISLRTLYRDIASLQQQGASIEGEPGLGYVLKPGFMLPPLMFTEEELEALVLGSRWVANRTDSELSESAINALVKISAVLPAELRSSLDENTLFVGPTKQPVTESTEFSSIRQAIRAEQKITIHYLDLKEQKSIRTIWPFALGYFDNLRVLAGWCELRQSFRHFRTDRILQLEVCEARYPRRRRQLLNEWRKAEGISSQ